MAEEEAEYDLGSNNTFLIMPADSSSSTTAAHPLDEKVMYGDFRYTFSYMTSTGQESANGEISNTVIGVGNSIEVTIPAMPNLDPSVDKIIVYRSSPSFAPGFYQLYIDEVQRDYLLPEEVVTAFTFVDNKSVESLGKLMPSRTLSTDIDDDGLFLTSFQGRLFMLTKDWEDDDYHSKPQDYSEYYVLKWSVLGQPTLWESLSFLNLDYPCTGLGESGNGLIVYDEFATHVLQNVTGEVFNFQQISASHGCIDHRSIQTWSGFSICASQDGITLTNGGEVKLISYDKMGIMPMVYPEGDYRYTTVTDGNMTINSKILSSAVVGNQYFLLLKDNSVLRVDLLTNTFITFKGNGALGLGAIRGELCSSQNSQLYTIPYDRAGTSTYSVITGKITEGSLCNLKTYDKVRVNVSGNAYLTVYVDETVVIKNAFIGSASEFIGIPNEHCQGLSIQFQVSGVGALHSIEYTVKGRDNA